MRTLSLPCSRGHLAHLDVSLALAFLGRLASRPSSAPRPPEGFFLAFFTLDGGDLLGGMEPVRGWSCIGAGPATGRRQRVASLALGPTSRFCVAPAPPTPALPAPPIPRTPSSLSSPAWCAVFGPHAQDLFVLSFFPPDSMWTTQACGAYGYGDVLA
ncbi:hypothetical protein DFH09DRAFT_73011 [Mycena vulgaris]|nr:hypothetical protein DFH09DRAFT_73011 [Mycena vulgaris]